MSDSPWYHVRMAEQITMSIAVPKTLRRFVTGRMSKKGFGNVSEYVRHLIREDQSRAAEERIEELVLEGLASGKHIPVNAEYWAEKSARLEARIAAVGGRREAKAG